MADKIQFRRDTAARWIQFNPILAEGEMGLVTDNPNMYKIGDGVASWNNLPLRGYTGNISQVMGRDEDAVASEKVIASLVTFSKNDAGKHALSILNGKDLLIIDYKNTPWGWIGGYIDKNGVIQPGNSTLTTGYGYSDLIAVEEGEQIKLSKTYASSNILKIAAYDSDGNILLDKSVVGMDLPTNIADYIWTVPSGVYAVRFTNGMHINANPQIWSLSSLGTGVGLLAKYQSDKEAQEKWNEENNLHNLMSNQFDESGVLEQYIVNSPDGKIVQWATTNGTSAVSGFIPLPKDATQLYLFTDQASTNVVWMNCCFKNEMDLSTPGRLFTCLANGVAYTIPDDVKGQYKYVVLTIARFDGQYPVNLDFSNVAIGFDASFRDGISQRFLKQSVMSIITPELRYMSKDFQVFRRYKDNEDDITVRYISKGVNSTTLASNYYKAFLSLYITGLAKGRTYQMGMVRRGQPLTEEYDYSLLLQAWDDTNQAWVRAAYWTITGIDIEANNPNGVNYIERTTIGMDGKPATIKAEIDYSFIPDDSSCWINPTNGEQATQNFVIKDECFESLDDVYDSDGKYYNEKMRFIASGKNKFRPGSAITGIYINSSTGAKYVNSSDKFVAISEDIEVPDGATHVATQGFLTNSSYTYPSRLCCMDSNHQLIGGSSFSYFIAPILAGTKYIAVPLARNVDPVENPDWSDTMIEFSKVHTEYAPFRFIIDPEYLEINDPQELVNRIIAVEDRINDIETEPFKMPAMIMNLPSKTDNVKEGYVYIDDTDTNSKIFKLK